MAEWDGPPSKLRLARRRGVCTATRAWLARIDEHVIRGEIDNRTRGRVVGKIWFVDRAEPVELELSGDCWRDLAGRRLEFVNPEPKPGLPESFAVRQVGSVGEDWPWRTWKGHDWDAMNRLHEAGFISDPHNKNKSVGFTEEGERRAEELFAKLFGKATGAEEPPAR